MVHNHRYYLYGTTRDGWGKSGDGFDAWYSDDLIQWTFAGEVYRKPVGATWNCYQFWAPEVYFRNERFYMFYTGKSDATQRAVGIAVSESPLGPFIDASSKPLTPPDWDCLDGHLYTDEEGNNYLFYVHEWTQCGIGEMYIQSISKDLLNLEEQPIQLFKASDALWTSGKYGVVIDGPCLLVKNNKFYLMWSSFCSEEEYCVGYAISDSLLGPYIQSKKPFSIENGGHNTCFYGTSGELFTCYHSPNNTPYERLQIRKIDFDNSEHLIVRNSI